MRHDIRAKAPGSRLTLMAPNIAISSPLLDVVASPLSRLEPVPPPWVKTLLELSDLIGGECLSEPGVISAWTNGPFTLVATTVEQATRLSANSFAEAIQIAYESVGRELSLRELKPLRFWNFIPDIHGLLLPVGDRYMAFNVGRFNGLVSWLGSPGNFASAVPTSSAVGVEGDALRVYALAGEQSGASVENPRQRSSFGYSRRFGPRPPCFARATRVGSALFIGGTASIVGEDSRHVDQIERQTNETLANIAAVISVANPRPDDPPLDALEDVRVHVTHPDHAAKVLELLSKHARRLRRVEVVMAELCRRELLVEIEGVAALRAS